MSFKSPNIKIKESKTYIEDDYETAYRKARKELGADLVLIDKKEIKVGGIFGLFGKKKLQIIFGVEALPPVSKYAKTSISDDKELLELLKKIQTTSNVNQTENLEPNSTGVYNPYQNRPFINNTQIKQEEKKQLSEIELEKIREELKKDIKEELKKEFFVQNIGAKVINSNENNIENKYKDFIEKLKKNDIDEEIIPDIINYIESKNYSNYEEYLKGLREYFYNNIICYEDIDKKKVIMLVGPTGVGKTTSCAKIAANKWKEEKEIAFITADTYRLEAVSQLKGYANILKVSVEVINKPDELIPAIEKFNSKDFIIMDTAGRSPRNKQQMQELKEFIKNTRGSDIDVYLVLSATSKLEVIYDIIENFKYIGFNSFIFTKIDETTSIGAVLSICKKYKVPISYITTGQRVPDDIEIADKNRLTDLFCERFK